jgi:methylmalonyl-CoA mutase cobalamin-binding domain/chain
MVLTHKERILKVAGGEMVDKIPFVPRLDLWHNANTYRRTLPEAYKNMTADEIALANGWPLHKHVPEFLNFEVPEDTDHGGLGLYHLKEYLYNFTFSPEIDIRVERDSNMTYVKYHTPHGMVSTKTVQTEEMKNAGVSIKWFAEHAIKKPEDYRVCAYIFANLKFEPDYDAFIQWKDGIGENGLAVATGVGIACASPIHMIQKTLVDATQFFLHYEDYEKEMQALAEAIEHCYDQILDILVDSPAEAILWGANFDSMITYPAYFEKDILPWCRKVAEALHAKGKLMVLHPDGENELLMDLLVETGADICEAVTPHPMTKITIDEYYDRWCRSDKLTLWGGIPESLLLEKSTTAEEFEAYFDHLFDVIYPGKRLIAGIGDTSPPDMVFERLIRIAERFEKQGRLPLEAGAARPLSAGQLEAAKARATPEPDKPAIAREILEDKEYMIIIDDVLSGRHKEIQAHITSMLEQGFTSSDILNRGMLSAMEVISERFRDGTVFIPEVLKSARAMNAGTVVLEPFLAEKTQEVSGKILIGTVKGDMHDIGKNLVITMLRGVGFDIVDMGVNVDTAEFVRQVADVKPDILGMSALLTTTMPQMQDAIFALVEAGLRDRIKIMVGGAPVNQKFNDDIGADGYAADAGDAVDLVRQLLSGN